MKKQTTYGFGVKSNTGPSINKSVVSRKSTHRSKGNILNSKGSKDFESDHQNGNHSSKLKKSVGAEEGAHNLK